MRKSSKVAPGESRAHGEDELRSQKRIEELERKLAFAQPHNAETLQSLVGPKNEGGDDGGWTKNCTFDQYGRVLPNAKLWPSGIAKVAQRNRALGLRTGVWVGRGVHAHSLGKGYTVLGTNGTVLLDDIVSKSPTGGIPNASCSWDRDLFGANTSHWATPLYYASVVRLLASWGIQFIKGKSAATRTLVTDL